jgi:hypothetical protein
LSARLTESVFVLVQKLIVEEYQEPLAFNVDGEPNVLVDGLRRCEELLAEDVEQAIAANESNEVIVATLRLG